MSAGSLAARRDLLALVLDALVPASDGFPAGSVALDHVLAMAAARLGSTRVVAADTDPEACAIAQENFLLNGFRDDASAPSVVHGGLERVVGPFDVILANLFPLALEEVRDSLAAQQAPRGALVLSGFSADQAASLSVLYTGAGYAEQSCRTFGEWAALVMRKVD